MRQKSVPARAPAEQVVKDIRRATRRHFSAEDKIRIVLEGLRGEESIAELCRREGIVQNLYYRWSKDFLEAGKKRLAGDTARAPSDEVKDPASRGQRAEGGRGRADPRESSSGDDGTSRPRTRSASFRGGPARRGEHRRAVPARRGIVQEPRHYPLVEGLPGGGQEAEGWRAIRPGQATSDEVKDHAAARPTQLKEVAPSLDRREPCAQKKHASGMGETTHARYPACEIARESSGWSERGRIGQVAADAGQDRQSPDRD